MTMTQERPAEAVDSFAALSAAVHPAWHMAILRLASATERVATRFDAWAASSMADGGFVRETRDLAAALIDFLDELDPDADLEPSLGTGMNGGDDREQEDEHDEDSDPAEDDGTAEPSLGAIERHPSVHGYGRDASGHQLGWTDGNGADLEDEHDGCEPPEDCEPSLGWTADGDLGVVGYSGMNDYESDDYAGRVAYLDRRRAKSPVHNRPAFWRGPNDSGPRAA